MAEDDTFYKVVMHGASYGQDVINILWYRLGVDILPTTLNLSGAEDLANNIKTEVWDAAKGAMSPDYILRSIDVYPFNGLFDLIYSTPFTLDVNEPGNRAAVAAGGMNGPAPCVIVKLNLEPTTLLSGINPPRRGYLALGPVQDGDVANNGVLTPTALGLWQDIADLYAANIEQVLPAPAAWFPIRVRTVRALGVTTVVGFADVQSAVARAVVSFRRSRLPEA